ncbi:MAG: MFS transporter [Bacteroidetes bacterium]|nr:MFS transporter [Bacteroidota bacterium]MBK8671699.1 MFS transporter [Bacteroidota bacterium]MBK9634985.1 MFS transporter [Bacteroidota bacterium]
MFSKITKYYLDSYKGLSPEIWWLSFVNLINRCGTMVLAFLILYLINEKGMSLSKAGLIFSFYGIGAILGSLIGGKLTDLIGFYIVQISTLIFGGLMFIVLGFLNSYLSIAIFVFVLGCVNEAFRPANSAAMAAYSTAENRTRSFSLMRLSFNLGWALGGGLGGIIAAYSYHLLFWIDGLTNILAALMLLVVLPYRKYKEIQLNQKKIEKTNEKSSPLKDKTFIKLVLITILYTSCFFQMFTNLTAYFKSELKFTEQFIGLLLAWNGIMIVVFEMVLIFWIERHWTMKKAILVGLFFHIIAYLLLVVFPVGKWMAFHVITLITLSEMFAFAMLMTFWMKRTTDSNRGQYAGIWTMSWAVSQSIGPATGAFVGEKFGFNYLWLGVSLLCSIAFFLYVKLFNSLREKNRTTLS